MEYYYYHYKKGTKMEKQKLSLHILFLTLSIAIISGCTAIKAIKLVNSSEARKSNPTQSTVPFRLLGDGIMLVKVKLNHSPQKYTFIFDTGAITVLRKEVAKELAVKKGVDIDAGGTGGNSKRVNMAALESISLGSMEVTDCAVVVNDFSTIFSRRIDGILGSNYLKHFKVTINYTNKTITLSSNTKPIATQSNEIKVPFKADMLQGFAPVIKCKVDGIQDNGLIDTGFSGMVGIPVSMVKKYSSSKNGSLISSDGAMGGGLFGMANARSYAMRLNAFSIGQVRLQNVPAVSHLHKGGQVLIGNKLLENYIVTLNYPAGEMILKPTGAQHATNIPTYGLALSKKGTQTVISGIWQNSPAAKAGLKRGDEVIAVNNIKTSSASSMGELVSMFYGKKTKSAKIEYMGKNGRRVIVLKKKNLLP
jgi:predicted aspartyl protease